MMIAFILRFVICVLQKMLDRIDRNSSVDKGIIFDSLAEFNITPKEDPHYCVSQAQTDTHFQTQSPQVQMGQPIHTSSMGSGYSSKAQSQPLTHGKISSSHAKAGKIAPKLKSQALAVIKERKPKSQGKKCPCGREQLYIEEKESKCCSKCGSGDHHSNCNLGFLLVPSLELCETKCCGISSSIQTKSGSEAKRFCCIKCMVGAGHSKSCLYCVEDSKFFTKESFNLFLSSYSKVDFYRFDKMTESEKRKTFTESLKENLKLEIKVVMRNIPRNIYLNRSELNKLIPGINFDHLIKIMPLFGEYDLEKGYMFERYPSLSSEFLHKNFGRGASRGKNQTAFGGIKFLTVLSILSIVTASSMAQQESVIECERTYSLVEGGLFYTQGRVWRVSNEVFENRIKNFQFPLVVGRMIIERPDRIVIQFPCHTVVKSYKYGNKSCEVVDNCDIKPKGKFIFLVNHYCNNVCSKIGKCEELINDIRNSCIRPTKEEVYQELYRKYNNMKSVDDFYIVQDSAWQKITSVVQALTQPSVSARMLAESNLGIVTVNGIHTGTFFCFEGKAYTAYHVVEKQSEFFNVWGSAHKVQLCRSSCITVDSIKKLEGDVAVIDTKFCQTLTIPKHVTSSPYALIAYEPSTRAIVVLTAVMRQSTSSTTIEVTSGTWKKGMSGGALIKDGSPIGVVTAMKGYLFGQEVKVYTLDGKEFTPDNYGVRWEL